MQWLASLDWTPIIIAVMVLVELVGIGFAIDAVMRNRTPQGTIAWAIALGALLGGALGNLCDRLTRPPGFGRGYVVDFIAFPHFAVFNVADIAITCAAAFMVILALRGVSFSGASVKG